jgi:hypothetical protein
MIHTLCEHGACLKCAELENKLAIAVDALKYISEYMCIADMEAQNALDKIGEV